MIRHRPTLALPSGTAPGSRNARTCGEERVLARTGSAGPEKGVKDFDKYPQSGLYGFFTPAARRERLYGGGYVVGWVARFRAGV